jgi:hypothetical protein
LYLYFFDNGRHLSSRARTYHASAELLRIYTGEAGMPDDDSDSLGLAGEEDPLSEQAVDLKGARGEKAAEQQILH